jgi:hypothetical protein
MMEPPNFTRPQPPPLNRSIALQNHQSCHGVCDGITVLHLKQWLSHRLHLPTLLQSTATGNSTRAYVASSALQVSSLGGAQGGSTQGNACNSRSLASPKKCSCKDAHYKLSSISQARASQGGCAVCVIGLQRAGHETNGAGPVAGKRAARAEAKRAVGLTQGFDSGRWAEKCGIYARRACDVWR